MPLRLYAKLSVYVHFFPGERVHHFHQIIKGICDSKKGLQRLRGIPVIHFITGLGNGDRKLKMASKKRREGHIVDLFPLFTFGK